MEGEDKLDDETRMLKEELVDGRTELLCSISFQGRRQKQGSRSEWLAQLKVSCAEG